MDRAYSLLTVKAVEEDQRIIRGVATTPLPDRIGDIVEPLGVKFTNPLPLLHQHNADEPVGTVTFAKPTKDGITFEARLPRIEEPPSLKDRIDTAWAEVKAGLVRAVSIGFRPIEFSFLEDGGVHFQRTEVLELSLVSVPANADATITQIRSIDGRIRAASGCDESTVERRADPPGASGKPKPSPKGTKMKTIAEQIAAFEATRVAKSARMDELMNEAGEKGETLDAAQKEEYKDLQAEVKEIEEHLVLLHDLEKRKASTAKAVEKIEKTEDAAAARAGVQVIREVKLPAGIEFARYAMCLTAAKGFVPQALEIARSRYPDSPRIITSLKAAVAAGTTTDANWAGALIDYQHFAGDFIEFLRPLTIIGKFGNNGIPSLRRVPFNIQIAGQTTGGAGYWVGEGQPKPLTSFQLANITMTWAKVAAIAVLTEELVRFSSPSAEALVRDALAAALIERIDTDFVDPTKAAVSNVSPASITNAATPIVSSGTDLTGVYADIQAIMGAFIAANISPADGVWIMNPNSALGLSLMRNPLGAPEFGAVTMMGGTFMGLPVITSKYVPDGFVILANTSDIYLADDGQVVLDASREASLQMDSAPTNNTVTPTATTMVSMFQTNSIALRAERYINWKLRRAASVQVLSEVDWNTVGGSDA